jgi:hypothetical protein
VRIIEDLSRTSPNFPLSATCTKCASIVEVELSDVEYDRYKTGGYWFNDTAVVEGRFTFDCAACGHANQVDATLIPVGSQQDMKAAYRARKDAGEPIV